MSEKEGRDRFPMLDGGTVPWVVAEEAYKVYSAKFGNRQSLEQIAERGGFDAAELVWLLKGATKKYSEASR